MLLVAGGLRKQTYLALNSSKTDEAGLYFHTRTYSNLRKMLWVKMSKNTHFSHSVIHSGSSIPTAFWAALENVPDAAVIGAPKAGSTFLRELLTQVPGITALPEDNYLTQTERPDAAVFNARMQVGKIQPEDRLIVHANTYMLAPPILTKHLQLNPNFKAMLVVRNPVERAFSHYLMDRSKGLAVNFQQAFEGPTGARYREYGSYSHHIENLWSILGKERLHVIFFEDIKRDPKGTLLEVLEFLGHAAPPVFVEAAFGGENDWKMNAQRRRLTGSADTSRLSVAVPVPLRPLVRKLFRRMLGLAGRMTKELKPTLSAQERSTLEEFYATETAVLEALLGRPAPSDWPSAAHKSVHV